MALAFDAPSAYERGVSSALGRTRAETVRRLPRVTDSRQPPRSTSPRRDFHSMIALRGIDSALCARTNRTKYAYAPFGRRIRNTVGAATTYYVWDGDQLLAEYDASGSRRVR